MLDVSLCCVTVYILAGVRCDFHGRLTLFFSLSLSHSLPPLLSLLPPWNNEYGMRDKKSRRWSGFGAPLAGSAFAGADRRKRGRTVDGNWVPRIGERWRRRVEGVEGWKKSGVEGGGGGRMGGWRQGRSARDGM